MANCLEAALTSLEALESIVSRSFGPNGLDIALKTDTGCILVTNSGQEILNSITLSHPIGRLIANQVNEYVRVTGDSTKQFILILTELLRNVSSDLIMQSKAQKINSTLAGVSNACGVLNKLILNGDLCTVLRPYRKEVARTNINEFEQCLNCLVNTALRGKFSPHALNILTEQIVKMVLHNSSGNLKVDLFERIQNLIEHYQDICIQVHGIGINNSTIKDGFILQQEPIGRCAKDFLHSQTRLICINHSFDFEEIAFATVHISFNMQGTRSHTQIRTKFVHRLSKLLEDNSVKLLLCKSKLPDYALSVLTQKFCILQNVDEDDLGRIYSFFNILPIEDLGSLFEEGIKLHAGHISEARCITIGTRRFFSITPEKNVPNNKPCCQLLLCAPSSGICQQYYKEIYNVLKILKMSFYEQYGCNKTCKLKMLYLPGAGATEIIFAKYFEDISLKSDNNELKLVAHSLSQAFLSIPRWLHKNSNNSAQNSKFVTVLKTLYKNDDNFKKCVEEPDLQGIDGSTGKVFNPLEFNVIEPYSSKVLLVDHVLQAAQQILKIDSIIPSKTTISSKTINSDSPID